jgi:hypothetical protein
MNQESLTNLLTRACALSITYGQSRVAPSSTSPLGQKITSVLRGIAAHVEDEVKQSGCQFVVSISKGQSNIPRIFYVAASRSARALSTDPSVAICFAEAGNGFVAGMMFPHVAGSKINKPVPREMVGVPLLNLSSPRSKLNYNNKFVNPMECLIESLDEKALREHLQRSLSLLMSEYR